MRNFLYHTSLVFLLAMVLGSSAQAAPAKVSADQLYVGACAALLLPTGDFSSIAEPSPGLALTGGYWPTSQVAIFGNFHYFSLENAPFVVAEQSLYTLGLGARVQWDQHVIQPYAQLELGFHTARATVLNFVSSESAFGGIAGVGLGIPLSPSLRLDMRVSYLLSEFDNSGEVSASVLSLGLSSSL